MKRLPLILIAIALLSSALFSAPFASAPAHADDPIKTKHKAKLSEKKVYRAMGGPTHPKVPIHWNRFYDYQQTTDLLKKLAAAHPEKTKLESLGKSYDGLDLWLFTISNENDGIPNDQKAAMWVDGGLHANETQSVEVVVYTIWYLLEMYDISPRIKELVDQRVFYFAPMMSPDSRDKHFYSANNTHWPRSGQRPVDDDRDGLFDEDGTDDLDGDGHITGMRIRDDNGRYKPHPKYPQLLVKVKADEKGTYRYMGLEGFDNDGDGRMNEDIEGYYDPNRNWGWQWRPEYLQHGGHHYPFSIPENRAFADFMMDNLHIAGCQNFHNTGGLIVRGPGFKGDNYPKADLKIFDQMGKFGERILPGYEYINQRDGLYPVYGGILGYRYKMLGTLGFTNELFTPYNLFGTKDSGHIMATPEANREFDKHLLFDDAFVPWHEVEHPQYGKIEVGGLKKNFGRQPPSFMIEEMCHRNMAYVLYHADQMPMVKVQSIDVKQLEGGLQQVTAVVVNERLIPTRLAIDVQNNITPKDIVSLKVIGPDGKPRKPKVVLGLRSGSQFFDYPGEQKRDPANMQLNTLPGMGVTYLRWLVEDEGPFRVRIKSIKGGQHELMSDAKK